MPLGSYSLTYHFADQLCKHRPKTVLDVGVGFGLQGALVRQYLDGGVAPFNTQLLGIEAFGNYRNPVWDLYNQVLEEDLRTAIPGLLMAKPELDFIIFTDVLEHLERDEGMMYIQMMMELLAPGGVLVIGTPAVWAEQGAVHGNEFETHVSLWAWNEFPAGFEVIKNGEPDEFGHRMILVKYVKPNK